MFCSLMYLTGVNKASVTKQDGKEMPQRKQGRLVEIERCSEIGEGGCEGAL